MAQDIRSKVVLGIDVNEFRRGITQVDNSIKGIAGKFRNLGGIIGASFAGAKLLEFGKEAVMLGSQMEQVAKGFQRFGDEMQLEVLRQATKGLVTDLELMQKTVQAGNFGIPIAELGTLLEFAQRRAAETGESVEYLVNSVVVGLGRKSPKILDNLGISAARLKEAFNGAAVEAQSIGAVTEVVSAIAKEELAKMGEYVDTAADKVKRFETSWTNFKVTFGQTVAPVVGGFMDWFSSALTEAANATETIGTSMAGIVSAMMRIPSLFLGGADVATGTGQGTSEQQFLAGRQPTGMAPRELWFNNPQETIAPAVVTLASLQEQLKGLNSEFQNTAVASALFVDLRNQIDKLETKIEEYTKGVRGTAEATNVTAKSTNDLSFSYERTGQVLPQLNAATNEYQKSLNRLRDANIAYLQEQALLNYISQEFGMILTSSFQAALISGDDFFETLKVGIKNYINQMLAATAATLALAAAIGIIFPQIGFKAAFSGIGGGMGLPFGFNNDDKLSLRLSGSDFYTGIDRNKNRNQRSGG